MQQLDFSLFQPLNGSTPFKFVSIHPTEPLVALHAALDVQILQAPTFSRANIRCAIWDREARELVSAPEGAVALAWNAAGNEMGLVRDWHSILFGEEEEEEEDRRFFVETNLATAPVFSPDGRFLVFCWQPRQRWWTDVPNDMYVEGDLPARVGECHIGYAQIIDGETNTTRRLALFANLPPGWQPSYEGDRSNELLNEPVFIDSRHFQVRLPTDETAVYTVLA